MTEDDLDIVKAEQVLDEDHYGLEKPKERVLEYLAVQKLVKKMKGPILCLVGLRSAKHHWPGPSPALWSASSFAFR